MMLMPTQIEFAGRTIDLAKVLPLRLREYRIMARRGVDVDKAIISGNLEDLFQLMLVVLQAADPTVTEAELENLWPEAFLALWARVAEINTVLKGAEIPFASSSISSDVPSTGAPTPS